VLATILHRSFNEPGNAPHQPQQSGIARIDRWLDFVWRTSDAKSTVYELKTAPVIVGI
jgi:hypothetical protein